VTVREVYAEALVPLVADAPFAKYIGLELGGRLSNYSSVGDIETWKIGGEWAIVDQFRLRAMYNKATRAPSVFELFRAGDQNFPSYGDPCKNVGGAAALNGTVVLPGSAEYNFCANWIGLDPIGDPVGTDAALSIFAASDTQVETFLFGNSNLEPEEGETITAGAVLQTETPFGDISASVDWYNIQIDGFITSPTANQLLARCTATLNLASPECLATPRISTGQLGGLLAPNENTGTIETEGVDIAVAYNLVPEDVGLPIPGSLDVNALVSHLETWDQEGGGINGGAYAGIHTGFGGAFPEWKSTVRTTYSYNDWQFSWQWERIGEMDDYGYTALYPAYYPAVEAVNYHDFSVRWFATENVDATFVCENCFDEEPQNGTVSGYVAGLNVDGSTYDVLGRFYRFSLRARF
jgi:outer membrane receptor protein involved in Fe transport